MRYKHLPSTYRYFYRRCALDYRVLVDYEEMLNFIGYGHHARC